VEGPGPSPVSDNDRTEEDWTQGARDDSGQSLRGGTAPSATVAWLADEDHPAAIEVLEVVATTDSPQKAELVSGPCCTFPNRYIMAAMVVLTTAVIVASGVSVHIFLTTQRPDRQHQGNTMAPSAPFVGKPTASPTAMTQVPSGMDWANSLKETTETPSVPIYNALPSSTTTGSYWNLRYKFMRRCFTGYSVDISADGSTVAFSVRSHEEHPDQSCNYIAVYRFGRIYIPEHNYDISFWGGEKQNHFGRSISLSEDGTTLAVGTVDEGMVKVFRLHQESWEQLGKTLQVDKCQGLGSSVALANDRLAVASSNMAQRGNYECDNVQSDLGMVQIFDLVGGSWVKVSPNLGDDAKFQGSAFGSAIAISRDGRVVAAHIPSYNAFQNSVSVLYQEVQSGQWVRMGQGIESGKLDWGYGSQNLAVSANGKRFAVAGMKKETGSAYVKVMEWRDRMWEQVGDDIEDSDDCCFSENFPTSVSLSDSGTRLVFGNSGFGPLLGEEAYNPGIVRIYDWNGASWVQVGQSLMIDPPNENPETWFGFSTAISAYGGRVVVAAGKGGVHGIYDLIA